MKFSFAHALSGLAFIACAAAQRIKIGAAPTDMSTISPGQPLLVEVDRPNSLSGSTEVAIVIGLNSCNGQPCASPTDTGLGNVLYNGPFDPQYYVDAPAEKPPHQNFTVTVPNNIQTGNALLTVYHAALIGASWSPFTELVNLTLQVV